MDKLNPNLKREGENEEKGKGGDDNLGRWRLASAATNDNNKDQSGEKERILWNGKWQMRNGGNRIYNYQIFNERRRTSSLCPFPFFI